MSESSSPSPLRPLDRNGTESLFQTEFTQKFPDWTRKTIEAERFNQPVRVFNDLTRAVHHRADKELVYYVSPGQPQIVVVTTPVGAHLDLRSTGLSYYHSLDHTIALIKEDLQIEAIGHLICPLVGQGKTEPHVTTFYMTESPGKRTTQVFDSKDSNPETFAQEKSSFSDLFSSSSPDLIKIPSNDSQIPFYLQDAEYVSLKGEQSFIDAKTCGYRQVLHAMKMVQWIQKRKTPDHTALSNISTSLSHHVQYKNYFLAAWYETFLPEILPQERHQQKFSHYFFGVPDTSQFSDGKARVVWGSYLLGGCVFTPAKNILKLATEFVLKWIVMSLQWVFDLMCLQSPKSVGMKWVRSGAVAGTLFFWTLFTGLHLFVRTITSPITSYRAAGDSSILKALSIISSVVGISALVAGCIIALAPLAAGLGGTFVLAKPLVWLLGQFNVILAPGLVNSIAIMACTFGAFALNGMKEWFSEKTYRPTGTSIMIDKDEFFILEDEEPERPLGSSTPRGDIIIGPDSFYDPEKPLPNTFVEQSTDMFSDPSSEFSL